jgi:hypothetical protein
VKSSTKRPENELDRFWKSADPSLEEKAQLFDLAVIQLLKQFEIVPWLQVFEGVSQTPEPCNGCRVGLAAISRGAYSFLNEIELDKEVCFLGWWDSKREKGQVQHRLCIGIEGK